METPESAGRTIFKTPSGPTIWQEADSLLPETPLTSGAFEVASYPVGDGRRARLALYGSHFLSTWGQRAWEFLVGLVMLDIHPSSLLLVSIFGLCDAAAVVILGPAVGSFLDKTPRLRAACTMYVAQNACVAISAAACLALVLKWGSAATAVVVTAHGGIIYWIFVVVAIMAGSLSSVGALGATLSVEREWTKTLSGGDSDALAAMNAVMKRIDLICLIASPIGVGLLMTWKVNAAVVGVLAWNLAAWVPECSLLRRAQEASPALAAPKAGARIDSQSVRNKSIGGAGSPEQDGDLDIGYTYPSGKSENCFATLRLTERCMDVVRGWATYVKQPAAPAALSLALLYFTVMSFGTLMTAYLKWSGMKEAELSIYRGFGALSGIASTLVFPLLHRRWGLVKTGVAAIWVQLLCLIAAAVPAVVTAAANLAAGGGIAASSPPPLITRLVVAGLVFSRFGLWGFDLAVNQIMQETISDSALGSVTGVQGSLQSLFQMLAYVAGVVVWQPQRFPFLMAGSVGVVGVAAAIFSGYAVSSGCSHLREHVAPVPGSSVVYTP